MKKEKSSTKRIVALCLALIRANKTKILWLTGLFLILMPIHLFNIIFCWILITLMMKTEDECRIDSLHCSLPIRRWDIVISRFLVSLGIILAAILIGLFVLRISSIFSAAGIYPEKILITKNIFFVLFPILLLVSIYFPLYFRYGHQPGIQVSCYTGSLIITAAWVAILYTMVSIASGSWQIRSGIAIIKKSIAVFGIQFFRMYLFVPMALLIFSSFILSMKWYSKREF